MTDIFSPKKRSAIMRRIRSRGNRTTELRFAELLRRAKITGWRRHLSLPGSPDFTFPSARVCVFIHGCFWHGCPKCVKVPASNADFWDRKIKLNQDRDRRASALLRQRGFRVLVIWECDLRKARAAAVTRRVQSMLRPVECTTASRVGNLNRKVFPSGSLHSPPRTRSPRLVSTLVREQRRL